MTIAPVKLPPNAIARFYRGGPAISDLRGFDPGGDRVPEEWIGSTTAVFGEQAVGLSELPGGALLRDAIAADPTAWLGPAHAAERGPDPALLVKLLDAGERLPVHVHPDGPFARAHLGMRYGKTEAWIVIGARPGARVHVGFRDEVDDGALAELVAGQDHDAMLGALNPVDVAAGDAIFVPAGTAHAIGEGLLIVELQEPTDLSILLEWDGFGIADTEEATLGLGWSTALACVNQAASDASHLRGPAPDGAVSDLLPAPAADFFRAHRVAPGEGTVELDPGFAVAIVTDGAGELAGLSVTRGDALVVPYAAGPIAASGDLTAIVCRPPEVAR
jgi:mannose-6-phosphate isomerase